MQIVDQGTSTTITYSGTATVLNESTSAFGDGWKLEGLEQITPATGGVILNLGDGGESLWFSGSSGSVGGTYTDPPGDFSTLVQNSNGSYTRHPDRRHPDHVQFQRLRDGHDRPERPAHDLCLQRLEPAERRSPIPIRMSRRSPTAAAISRRSRTRPAG